VLVRFSAADVPKRDRLAVAREVFGRMIVHLDVEPLPGVPLRFDMVAQVLPELIVSNVAFSPVTVKRTPALTADGNDSVRLLKLSSRTEGINVSQLGRELAASAGEAVLLSNADATACTAVGMSRCLSVRVPRRVLVELVPQLEDAFVRPIPRNSETLKLLMRYLDLLKEDQELIRPQLCGALVNHVHDLLALTLGASREAAEIANGRGMRAARLRAIMADIQGLLDSPDLSIAALARRHGVTPRYVQKLFESEGMTFSQFLLDQRLARVHRVLTSPPFHGRRISDVALDAGFGDLSHFNRNFRRHYGESPSDVRAAAMRAKATANTVPWAAGPDLFRCGADCVDKVLHDTRCW
jgi:AraC-like DNA-binding protein